MMPLVSFILSVLAIVLAIPVATLFVEVAAARLYAGFPPEKIKRRSGRVAILVPAHNESAGLIPTLDDLRSQIEPGDRVLVVADNCTDDTAIVARSRGAEVAIRSDPARIGKGYALDWGIKHLRVDPPEIVIMVDADCRLGTGAIEILANAAAEAQRPAQGLYLMKAPPDSAVNHQVAEFAWRLKNWIRPLGLKALGSPCQLMGTGMAFPWRIIENAALSSASIVEDLQLGIELACAGYPPLFCPMALVTSTFPNSKEGALKQRQRWEHGHVGLIFAGAPRLLYAIVKHRDLRVIAIMLDLLVPPLSLLGIVLLSSIVVGVVAASSGLTSIPLIVSLSGLSIALAALVIAWLECGREVLPARSFGLLAAYVTAKLRMYGAALLGRRVSSWIRADRN